MTKEDEIALIDKTIATFGPASYFGPWLKDNRDQIISEIRSDLPIDVPTPGQAIAQAQAAINNARADSDSILKAARAAAGDLIVKARAQARKDADAIRAACRRTLERAAGEL